MNPKPFVIVTGANRGIGFATARALVARGAHAILAVRDVKLDLASLESVRAFAAAYTASGQPLHALVNNAGPINALKGLELTRDGFETFFGVNHLGHFLLTALLLPALWASAPSRVITVSSTLHARTRDFDWDNLAGEKSYDQGAFYNRTKLANVWFAYALARRLEGSAVVSIAACPGFVPQTLMVGQSGLQGLMFRVLDRMPFTRTPQEAGDDFARFALDPAFTGANGAFYSSGKLATSSDLSHDRDGQERLWALSRKLVGLEVDWNRTA